MEVEKKSKEIDELILQKDELLIKIDKEGKLKNLLFVCAIFWIFINRVNKFRYILDSLKSNEL